MKKLEVRLTHAPDEIQPVGILAEESRRIYFEYDGAFLADGVSPSPFKLPFKLPLEPGLHEHTDRAFGPLPGVFEDSLPDGWGLLLMDRHFRKRGSDPDTLSPLDRLAYVGTRTMGALTYHPPLDYERDEQGIDLHELGRNAEEILAGEAAEVLPALMRAGGSPAGARPKVLVGIRGDHLISGEVDLPAGFEAWMIKFAARADARNAGPIEYAYARMAEAAGIEMPETRLFEVRRGHDTRRYFGVKRFDREAGNRRIHVHTFANLIHADFRTPSSDYADLLKVTRGLTRNHADVRRAFRQMAFNIASHNRDDHAKNFAFLLDRGGEWSLSPAYDITYSRGPGGEHTMTVQGEGRRPTGRLCLELAEGIGLRRADAIEIMDAVNAAVAAWARFADQGCCTREATRVVAAALAPLEA